LLLVDPIPTSVARELVAAFAEFPGDIRILFKSRNVTQTALDGISREVR
jgi:hypothetical protein